MREKRKLGKLNKWNLLALALLCITVLSAIKTLFVGLDIDEEYAVSLAYRLAKGDRLLQQAWEPHQLSGIMPALFAKVWLSVVGTEYLVLFLRVVGLLFQWGTALVWVLAFRGVYDNRGVFLSGIVIANVLPKWIQVPEFANMQIWCLLLAIAFMQLREKQEKAAWKSFFLVLSALSVVWMVLAYPSTVLVVLPFLWTLRKQVKELVLFLGVCVVSAGVFLGYVLSYISPDKLMTYVGYIFSDGEHSASLLEKFAGYGRECLTIILYIAAYMAVSALIALLVKKIWKKAVSIELVLVIALFVASIDQLILWMIWEMPNVHPQIRFLLLFKLAVVLWKKRDSQVSGAVEGLSISTSLLAFLAVLLLTNLTVQASLVHLLPGILLGIMLLCHNMAKQEEKTERFLRGLAVGIWIVVTLFGRLFLVRVNEGWHEDILLTRQKALYGAAKGIYGPYMVGTQYNADYLLLNQLLEKNTKLLYLGHKTLTYTMGEYDVCGASLISTPVYGQAYVDYFALNADKIPDAVVVDKNFWEGIAGAEEHAPLMTWIEEHFDFGQAMENDYILVLCKKNVE